MTHGGDLCPVGSCFWSGSHAGWTLPGDVYLSPAGEHSTLPGSCFLQEDIRISHIYLGFLR